MKAFEKIVGKVENAAMQPLTKNQIITLKY